MAAKLLALAAALALGALALGCGDSDEEQAPPPTGAELTEAWDAEAEAAYEAAELDRDDDFATGVPDAECFYLDQAGAEAIAATLGHDGDVELSDSNFLGGPPGEEEGMVCGLSDPSEQPVLDAPIQSSIAIVGAGTTTETADQHRERLLREDDTTELEGSADGLAADEVVAVDREGVKTFMWVSEGFSVSFSGAEENLAGDTGFDALGTAVAEVSRTLTD
jgi:hypothetical protein